MRQKLGICHWFHDEDDACPERSVALLGDLGVKHVRTGISWAGFELPGGPEGLHRRLDALAEFEVLLTVWQTPPDRAEGRSLSGPPRRLDDFADFIETLILRYGERFTALELWTAPNHSAHWDHRNFDPAWSKFGAMVRSAAAAAHAGGRRVVLGGMRPADPTWLRLMDSYHALADVDRIAVQAFPLMCHPDGAYSDRHEEWFGWRDTVELVQHAAGSRPIWITDTGMSTHGPDSGVGARFDLQVEMLENAAAAPVERIYWASLLDGCASWAGIAGRRDSASARNMGIVDVTGTPKPAFERMRELLTDDLT